VTARRSREAVGVDPPVPGADDDAGGLELTGVLDVALLRGDEAAEVEERRAELDVECARECDVGRVAELECLAEFVLELAVPPPPCPPPRSRTNRSRSPRPTSNPTATTGIHGKPRLRAGEPTTVLGRCDGGPGGAPREGARTGTAGRPAEGSP
jgi:hypothetical protein